MKLDNYKCEGQLSIFDYLKAADPEPRQLKSEQPKICQYSQHTCNKANLWEVADTLDGIKCPRTCCRICSVKSCGARCNGSEEPKTAAGQTVDRYGRLREAPDWMDPKRCETCKYWSRYPVEEQPPAGWGVYGQCDYYHEPEMMKNGYWKVSKTSCCCDYKAKY